MSALLYPAGGTVPTLRTGDLVDVVVHNTSSINSFNFDCQYRDNSTDGVTALTCQGAASSEVSTGITCGGYNGETACGVGMAVPPCTANLGPWLCYYSVGMSDGSVVDTQWYAVINISSRATTTTWGSLPTHLAVVSSTSSLSSSTTSTTSAISTSTTSTRSSSSTSVIPTATSSAQALAAAEAAAAARHHRIVIGGAVGGAIGSALLVLALLLSCCFFIRRRKRANEHEHSGGITSGGAVFSGNAEEKGPIVSSGAEEGYRGRISDAALVGDESQRISNVSGGFISNAEAGGDPLLHNHGIRGYDTQFAMGSTAPALAGGAVGGAAVSRLSQKSHGAERSGSNHGLQSQDQGQGRNWNGNRRMSSLDASGNLSVQDPSDANFQAYGSFGDTIAALAGGAASGAAIGQPSRFTHDESRNDSKYETHAQALASNRGRKSRLSNLNAGVDPSLQQFGNQHLPRSFGDRAASTAGSAAVGRLFSSSLSGNTNSSKFSAHGKGQGTNWNGDSNIVNSRGMAVSDGAVGYRGFRNTVEPDGSADTFPDSSIRRDQTLDPGYERPYLRPSTIQFGQPLQPLSVNTMSDPGADTAFSAGAFSSSSGRRHNQFEDRGNQADSNYAYSAGLPKRSSSEKSRHLGSRGRSSIMQFVPSSGTSSRPSTYMQDSTWSGSPRGSWFSTQPSPPTSVGDGCHFSSTIPGAPGRLSSIGFIPNGDLRESNLAAAQHDSYRNVRNSLDGDMRSHSFLCGNAAIQSQHGNPSSTSSTSAATVTPALSRIHEQRASPRRNSDPTTGMQPVAMGRWRTHHSAQDSVQNAEDFGASHEVRGRDLSTEDSVNSHNQNLVSLRGVGELDLIPEDRPLEPEITGVASSAVATHMDSSLAETQTSRQHQWQASEFDVGNSQIEDHPADVFDAQRADGHDSLTAKSNSAENDAVQNLRNNTSRHDQSSDNLDFASNQNITNIYIAHANATSSFNADDSSILQSTAQKQNTTSRSASLHRLSSQEATSSLEMLSAIDSLLGTTSKLTPKKIASSSTERSEPLPLPLEEPRVSRSLWGEMTNSELVLMRLQEELEEEDVEEERREERGNGGETRVSHRGEEVGGVAGGRGRREAREEQELGADDDRFVDQETSAVGSTHGEHDIHNHSSVSETRSANTTDELGTARQLGRETSATAERISAATDVSQRPNLEIASSPRADYWEEIRGSDNFSDLLLLDTAKQDREDCPVESVSQSWFGNDGERDSSSLRIVRRMDMVKFSSDESRSGSGAAGTISALSSGLLAGSEVGNAMFTRGVSTYPTGPHLNPGSGYDGEAMTRHDHNTENVSEWSTYSSGDQGRMNGHFIQQPGGRLYGGNNAGGGSNVEFNSNSNSNSIDGNAMLSVFTTGAGITMHASNSQQNNYFQQHLSNMHHTSSDAQRTISSTFQSSRRTTTSPPETHYYSYHTDLPQNTIASSSLSSSTRTTVYLPSSQHINPNPFHDVPMEQNQRGNDDDTQMEDVVADDCSSSGVDTEYALIPEDQRRKALQRVARAVEKARMKKIQLREDLVDG